MRLRTKLILWSLFVLIPLLILTIAGLPRKESFPCPDNPRLACVEEER